LSAVLFQCLSSKRTRYRQIEVGKKVEIAGFGKPAKAERKDWFGSRAGH
jgi:hypothetical protein